MSEKKEKYTAVVLAAGKGTRMGGSVAKQFLEIGGKPVVVYALEVFEHSPEIDQIILVTGADKIEYCQKEIIEKYGIKKTVSVCAGGRERYESVWKALQTLKSLESEQDQKTDYVLIHDGARPFLNQEMLERLCACVKEEKACVLGMPVKDTIKHANDGAVVQTPDRAALFAVQTPQCFCRNLYWKALEAVQGEKVHLVTDDCSLFELAGLPVHLTQGDYANLKITTKEDLPAAAQNKGENTMRIGHGYDVHRLVEGRKLIMGGVTIPYEKGLLGHSDADVLLHAVSDALLGAAALGDIGKHFPDTDPRYEGADSLMLLREVGRLLDETGYTVGNIDATVLCQAPKLAPHIPAMRQNIANALGLALDDVSVKATTEEHLGFTGEGLGIAAHAVALIEKK